MSDRTNYKPLPVACVQDMLKAVGLYEGAVDGQATPELQHAVIQATSDIQRWENWEPLRKGVGHLQLKLRAANIDPGPIDGWYGSQTEFACERYAAKVEALHPFVDLAKVGPEGAKALAEERDDAVTGEPAEPTANLKITPKTTPLYTPAYGEMSTHFGATGTHWGRVESPFPLRIAWERDKELHAFTCHEKLEEELYLILKTILEVYGLEKIQELGLDLWGGCGNDRPMRGGRRKSTHAWAAAIDWDPDRNRLHETNSTARFARPEYKLWLDIWEAYGWYSLGRYRNMDFMHVQKCRVAMKSGGAFA